MARYRLDSIAELARQLTFSPQETRLAQLAAAEDLLHAIDAAKAYPLDFVVFRITEYHPKQVPDHLLTGMALQHDLGLLIEEVSQKLPLRTADLAEPVLTIEDVTERFNVASKTIQRWRRRGLPARHFEFPDGRFRVGFLLGSVERFFAAHRDQVERSANFSQLTEAERQEILRRARRLASACHCCQQEISRRIGRKMDRSPLTILHTIRKHDQECPREAIFPAAAEPLGDDERQRVVKAYRRGIALGTLARRLCRPRAAVARVLIEERLARINRRKVRFIDDPLFHSPDAARSIEAIASQEELAPAAAEDEARAPRDLSPFLAGLCRAPLLSPAGERALFLKFNFHKCQFVSARRRLDPQFAHRRELDAMEAHLRRAADAKDQIVRANLRLVTSVARKHLRPGLSLDELISEGAIALMRAVEGFDINRGNRFSTYATWALMKGFARNVPRMMAGRSGGGSEALGAVPDSRQALTDERLAARDEVRDLLARLDERERSVVAARYGLGGQGAGASLDKVGRRLGLSGRSVRRIELDAFAKLRAAVDASA